MRFESLEDRRLLAVDWRNPVNSLDVSDDGSISPIDPLQVINELNLSGSHVLSAQRPSDKPYWDVSGDNFISPLDALQVINALNANQTVPYVLSEGPQIATEQGVTITVGQTSGTRTYRLQVTPTFDKSDTQASSPDLFAIYLVDPQQASQTLLDRGTTGTTLFTLSESGAEFVPGRVRWDGQVVEIDLADLTNRDTAELRLQLLNNDGDGGSRVVVRPLSNEVDAEGVPSPVLLDSTNPNTAGTAFILTGVPTASNVALKVENVRFSSATQRYAAELRLQNQGDSLGRSVAVAFPGLPSGVTLRNPSGTTADGDPYINFAPAIARGGLSKNSRSDRLLVEFDNPSRVPFALSPQIFAGANQPPTLAAIGPLTVTPGGVLRTQLTATDPDGDRVAFALAEVAGASAPATLNLPTGILRGDGSLEFMPRPDQLGQYTFDVIASDGALEARRTVTLNIVADPLTTTRISGFILDVDRSPLAGMQVEIGAVQGLTLADGSFTLDLGTGPIVGDTLKVRGETFPGPLVYPFIAEKLAFVLEHDVFPGVNNIITRPIFLPPLDVAGGTTIDPMQDTMVQQEVAPSEMVEVFVAAGTLMNQQGTPFTGVLSITEVAGELTPAALPDTLFPDLVVTIQPGEMVFAAPAPMTFPNRSGWAPGTLMDLWSINPVTGEFDDVGDMQVSADGSLIETISGGVRNSSWHFPAPPPPNPHPEPDEPECDECDKKGPYNSEVNFNSGEISEMHDLPTYESLGESRGVQLVYNSLRADPRPILHVGYDDINPNIFSVPSALKVVARASVNVSGVEIVSDGFDNPGQFGLLGGENFWSIPAGGGPLDVALQVDLSEQPTGVYPYKMNVGLSGFTGSRFIGSASTVKDTLLHVNTISSPFGAGWGIAGLQEIVTAADRSVMILDGDGSALLFEPAPETRRDLLVLGQSNNILRYNETTGTFEATFAAAGSGGLSDPKDAVFGPDGNLYVTNFGGHNVLRFNGQTGAFIDVFAARGSGGLEFPTVLDFGPDGNLYVGQGGPGNTGGGGNVLRYNGSTGAFIDVFADAKAASGLDLINGLTFGPDGNLYVTSTDRLISTNADRVLRFDGSTGAFLDTFVDPARLDDSGALTFGPNGDLFVIDVRFNQVQRYSGINGVFLGVFNSGGDLATAFDLQFGPDGNLYVASRGNDQVQQFNGTTGAFIDQFVSAGDGGLDAPQAIVFRPPPASSTSEFVAPPGDFSRLEKLVDGTFHRTMTDQTVYTFDIGGRLESIRDRNGNEMRYEYDTAGLLMTIIDPVGLATTFTYASGKIATITDPASRTTQFEHDAAGNLIRVTDPDGSQRNWEYDADHHMTAETNQRGNREQSFYDEFGRASRAVRADGSVIQINPGQVQGLYPLTRTIDPANAPPAFRSAAGDARYIDANGNVTRTVLDAAGQEVSSTDSVGPLPTVERNAQNLITRHTDARGNETRYAYDDRGNLLFISDAITVGVLLSDNFDSEYGGIGRFDYTAFANWNVTRQGVDLIGNGLADIYPGKGLFLDMAGTSGISGRLESKTSFDLTPGTYELSFSLGNNAGNPTNPNALQVSLGSAFSETFTVTGAVPLQTITRTITVTTATQANLVFEHTDTESFGPVIDDVKLLRLDGGRFTYDSMFSQLTSQTDELGHQTLLDIDPANGNVRSITQVIGAVGGPDDLVTQFTYTTQGLIDTKTDPLGRVTDYDYDAIGRLLTVTMAQGTPDEGVRRFEYDAAGNLTAAIDENGHRTEYVYDALNRVTRITEPAPDAAGPLARPTTTFTYDAAGNLTSMTDSRGNTTRSEYDTLDRPTTTIDPNTSETRYRYDLAGNLTSMTDPLGHETGYRYDARNRLVETIDPDNGRTKFRYDADNNTTAVTDPVGNVTRHSYDPRDRLVRETDPLGNQTGYVYDAADKLIRRSEFEATTTNTTRRFDNFADLSGLTLNGAATAINATPVTVDGQVVLRLTTNRSQAATAFLTEPVVPNIADLTSFNTSFQFQITGAEGIISDEDGRGADGITFLLATSPTKLGGNGGALGFGGIGPSVAVEFDTHNNGLPSDGSGNHVGIDINGDLTSIVHANVTPRLNDGNIWFAWIDYHAASQQLEVRVAQTSQRPLEPVVATTVDLVAVLGQNDVFVGFSAGTGGGGSQKHDIRSWQLTAAYSSLAVKRQIEFEYDDVNRRTSETWVDGGNTIAYAYDKASNLLSATDTFSGLAMTYDARDRVQTVDNAGTPGVPNVVLTYAYDPAGNRLTTADTIAGAAGGLNSYTYDGLDRVTRVTQSGANVSNKRVDLAYNPLGQFNSIQRFKDLTGTQLVVGTNYTYDPLNRLAGLHHSNSANTDVSFFDFVYDPHSRITRITDIDGATDYSYDNRDQLIAADHADVGNPDESYTYDANGNRLTSSRHGNGYVNGPNNRLLSDGTFNYAYDHEGNLTRRTEITSGDFRDFVWDYRNRLTAVIDKSAANVETQRVEFTYDAFDRRISKSVDTTPLDAIDAAITHFVYDGQDVLLDFLDADGSGPTPPTLTQRYLHGPAVDQVLAQDNGAGNVLWHLSDHLGTVRDLANNTGTVANHLTYDSYGNVISETNRAIDNRYQFTGREFDAETGLYYYRARYYDAVTGRFISEDPVGFGGEDANLSRYVGNDPLGMRDPSGNLKGKVGPLDWSADSKGGSLGPVEWSPKDGTKVNPFSLADTVTGGVVSDAAGRWANLQRLEAQRNALEALLKSIEKELHRKDKDKNKKACDKPNPLEKAYDDALRAAHKEAFKNYYGTGVELKNAISEWNNAWWNNDWKIPNGDFNPRGHYK